jgi:hypothetical protein
MYAPMRRSRVPEWESRDTLAMWGVRWEGEGMIVAEWNDVLRTARRTLAWGCGT